MSLKKLDKGDCRNVLVVAITPRNEDQQVDLDGVRKNARYLVQNGVNFIMPECGTGLVYDASLEEYEAVVGTFIDEVGNESYVVPGIGPGFGRSLEMGSIANYLGADGVMIMPVVGPASAMGVYNGLKAITEKIKLPTILYQRRLDIMTVDDVICLCQLDEIIGLKYAVDNVDAFKQIAEKAGDQAAMTCGMAEDPCIEYLENGAIGFSSGMANFVPRMSMSLLQNFMSGNKAEAERLRSLMIPFEDFRGEGGARYSSSALHAAMDYVGLAGGPVIPFATDVSQQDLPRVHTMMDALMTEEKKL
ncbi:TPA: dihydrodipicolinate synthase family protein [Candidatus Poribacteria bacterium]|nr:dihydrodipicolinate synthase family protein [Candidatus Poribacteria bacterium]